MSRPSPAVTSLPVRLGRSSMVVGLALGLSCGLACFWGCQPVGEDPSTLVNPSFKTDLTKLPKSNQLDSSRKALASLQSQTADTNENSRNFSSWTGFWDSTVTRISTCGSQRRGCQDDCGSQIGLQKVTWQEKSPK